MSGWVKSTSMEQKNERTNERMGVEDRCCLIAGKWMNRDKEAAYRQLICNYLIEFQLQFHSIQNNIEMFQSMRAFVCNFALSNQ